MTVWLLVFVLFLKDGPVVVDHVYGDRFDCEVHMGVVATAAQKDPAVHGWTIPDACKAIPDTRKV